MATIDFRHFHLNKQCILAFYIQQGKRNRLKLDIDEFKYEVRDQKLVESIWDKVEQYCESDGKDKKLKEELEQELDQLKAKKESGCKKSDKKGQSDE